MGHLTKVEPYDDFERRPCVDKILGIVEQVRNDQQPDEGRQTEQEGLDEIPQNIAV
jgi:hypothetical protein